VLPPIAKALGFIGATMNFFVRISQKGYNQLCRRPDPLRAEEVQIWESMIENITSTLCEQSISGTIMMRNRIMGTDEDNPESEHNQWAYYVSFVSRMLLHITMNLERRIPYYQKTKKQREMLVNVANAVSLDDRKSIAFLIQIIADNLRHIVEVCKDVSSPDDLNTEHIKKISRNTLMLMKKLREMIGSQSKPDSFGITNFDSGAGQTNGKLS
jgi:hypothetical protein